VQSSGTARTLIDEGGSQHNSNLDRNTERLIQSIRRNNPERAEKYLGQGASLTTCDSEGYSALHHSVVRSTEEITKLILETARRRNEDAVNVRMPFGGKTALHLTAERGLVSMGEILIEFGANIHSLDNGNKTPYEIAVEHNEFKWKSMAERKYPNLRRCRGRNPGAI
jgi:ankyrin repeat protein